MFVSRSGVLVLWAPLKSSSSAIAVLGCCGGGMGRKHASEIVIPVIDVSKEE